ncbi:hypothetical protein H9638_10500 [Arthrobacter sp. Sa2BUA2]|uniref:Uncharacterized protein n=1 Tax=Arthrobacter pullicola TaxID=2762224 RepID=A0ABR8YJ56_9MICC|nr:hypothetical protein [Arthrobacter pullicola]MBD8044235.1 hypothetical protein [Arthrobacter pullicola]
MQYEIQPAAIHAVVIDVAADGQALHQAGNAAADTAADLAGSFGSADVVAGAFASFWTPRQDVAQRISSLVFRKTTALTDVAQALIDADGEMSAAAQSALSTLPTAYAPAAPPRTGRLRFQAE